MNAASNDGVFDYLTVVDNQLNERNGDIFVWGYKVRKSTVLYFALEDDYPRLQKRLFKMFGAEETDNLYFATQCKTLNEGLDEQIKGFMEEHSDTGLIIIDTLKRVREAGGADYSYASDYDIVARLKLIFLIAEEAVHPFSEVVDFIEVNESVLDADEFLGEYDLGHIQFKWCDILGMDSFERRIHFIFGAGKAEIGLTVSVFDFQFNHVKSPLWLRVRICGLP